MKMDYKTLLAKAEEARLMSYAPYSHFTVGAALLLKDGEVYTGCNIENSSYSATVCAERTALFAAIAEGKREFAALAISGGRQGMAGEKCLPCGVCRQVLSEFCSPDFSVIVGTPEAFTVYTLGQLLPCGFQLPN